MSKDINITEEQVERAYQKLKRETKASGYYLNPDEKFTKDLIKGLLTNEKRFGYWACPCRLAAGQREDDLDIICPCNYRDSDISEFNACYCALYVSSKASKGETKISSIPERRPPEAERKKPMDKSQEVKNTPHLYLPVWRCKVCGYLCGREIPPDICPICKVKKERFERFM